MAWDPHTSPIDYVLLADQESPGIAKIENATRVLNWDERQGYGYSGAFLWYRGKGLVHFEVKLLLHTVEDWAVWENWRKLLEPPTRRIPKAKDIWHPYLEQLGVKSAVVAELTQPKELSTGQHEITIKMIEFRRPRLSLVKPESSTSEEKKDFLDITIEKLQAENDALANG